LSDQVQQFQGVSLCQLLLGCAPVQRCMELLKAGMHANHSWLLYSKISSEKE